MTTLSTLLQKKLHDSGAISVAEYMALCLSHPEYGYYITRDPLGKEGDFTTAPEISQLFGELIGAWLATQWLALGSPSRCALVELGPGRGTLMQDALRVTRTIPGFHAALSVHLIETSPPLRAKQHATLADWHLPKTWHDSVDTIADLPLLLIANEFFDALPVQQYVWQDNAWYERMVSRDEEGRLVFCHTQTAVTHQLPLQNASESLPLQDDIFEYSPLSHSILTQLATHMRSHGGAGLIIDYGYSEPAFGDTLQAVKAHSYCSPLEASGEADLTAHVNFHALANTAKKAGCVAHGIVEQGVFLKRLGAELRAIQLCKNAAPTQQETILQGLERLVSPEQMGALFKVLAITSPEICHAEGFTNRSHKSE